MVLPHGTGKTADCCFCQGENQEAEGAGADTVGVGNWRQNQSGWLDFDVVLPRYDECGRQARCFLARGD